jgi:uncharacterized protein YpmB
MPVKLNEEQLRLYFDGNIRHRAYKETVDTYNAMRVHADGEVPVKLIQERRPSESEETFKYRKEIYVPKTKNPIGKVLRSLSKIRRSPDWSVKYDPKAMSTRIIEEESPENYCEENYPGHKSITNWAFSVLLKNNCIDANSVIAVFPLNPEAATNNEYYKPQAMVFNSPQVIFFEEGAEYAILQSSERSSLVKLDPNTNVYAATSKVFYLFTSTEFFKFEQEEKGSYKQTQYINHNIGELPVFKVRAEFLKQKENTIIQETRLRDMIPSLDEAAREYSDLQAAVVQHMHPLFWYYQSKACQPCGGAGKVIQNGNTVECSVCSGSGRIKFSPYAHMEVEPPKLGDQATPAPPAGYVSRDVEIMKLQDERVKNHLFDALASINMQFLDQTPLNISGEAKGVDREELTNFVYSVAEDLVWSIDRVYYFIGEWRYMVIVPDKKARKAMLPEVTVPEQFDLLPADYLMDGISKAKTAKVNPLLIAAMEEDYSNKAFYNDPNLAGQIAAYYDLDPLPGYSIDEKMSLLQNKGATQEDFVISAYIASFVKRAIAEDEEFLSKKLEEKQKVIMKYAQEKITANDKAEQVKNEMLLEQQQQMAGNAGNNNPINGGGQNNQSAPQGD